MSSDSPGPVRVTPMMSSGFPPAGTSREQLADLIAGAVGQVPGVCAAIGVLPGPPMNEVQASYPGLGWEERGPAADSESLIAALLVASRGRESDVDGLITDVHQAIAAAWKQRWGGEGPAALPLYLDSWHKARARATSWAESPCEDAAMVEAVRAGSRV